jgi:hypothetical protein
LEAMLTYEENMSFFESIYQQVRTCLEIGYNCVDRDPDKRPTAMEIIHRLEETESHIEAVVCWQVHQLESLLFVSTICCWPII